MALNLKKMQEKLKTLKGGRNDAFWRPNEGEQTIRIVPTEDGDPFKDYWFHYNLGKNAGFLSPKKNFGEDDPLDQFVHNLFNEGTTESVKMAKELMARQRFFTPVLVRGEEDKGVRVWGFGRTVYEKLLNLVLNPEYGDITDPESGTDLVLHYGKPAGAAFPQTEVIPRRRASLLCQDGPAKCKELMESIPDFDSLFERKAPIDVQSMLDEYLLGEEDAETVSSETERYNKPKEVKSESDASSVDQAFSELLGS